MRCIVPRDIPVGNGSLLVNFDQDYQLRDLYWLRVGQENHTSGHPSRFGVWVDGSLAWVADRGWERTLDYGTPDQQSDSATLVTRVRLVHRALGLELICRDLVDFHDDLYLRQVDVRNLLERPRQVRLFFHHDLHISGHDVGDSAYYEPERRAVFHYKGRRWFLIQTAKETETDGGGDANGYQVGLDQWAVGVKETSAMEGTWRDAEDGELSGNAVAQGSVDSTVALHLDLPGRSSRRGWYWIAVGEDFRAVTAINRAVRARGAASYLERTCDYWALWASKERVGRAAPSTEPLAEIIGSNSKYG